MLCAFSPPDLALAAPTPARRQANLRLGRHMAWQHGWIRGSWQCLRRLWTYESDWDNLAVNASSGAAGIPQELGHGAVSSAPRGQIRWGLSYIHVRYGGPCHALAFWLAHRWY